MPKTEIKTSYGRPATINGQSTGLFYGAGYGSNETITSEVDNLAETLAGLYPYGLEKRCNSDGNSGGAFHDDKPGYNLSVGYAYDRTTDKLTDVLKYSAGFSVHKSVAPLDELKAIQDIHYANKDPFGKEYNDVWSADFKTPEEALAWLQTYGPKYNHKLRGGEDA